MKTTSCLAMALTFLLLHIACQTEAAGQAPKVRAPKSSDGVLKWKFKKGQTLEMSIEQRIKAKLGQNTFATTNISNNEILIIVNDIDDDGVASITNKITRMKVKLEGPGPAIDYDSDSAEERTGLSAQIAKTLNPLIGFKITQKWAPNGKVSDIKIPEGVLDGALSGGMMNKDTLEQMSSQAALEFPSEKPAVGESWEQEAEMKVGPMKVKTDTTYKYLGVSDAGGQALHVIEGDIKLEFVGGPGGAKIDIADQDSKAYFYFDGNLGRLVNSTVDQNMTMKIAEGGQNIEQKLNQKVNVTVTENSLIN